MKENKFLKRFAIVLALIVSSVIATPASSGLAASPSSVYNTCTENTGAVPIQYNNLQPGSVACGYIVRDVKSVLGSSPYPVRLKQIGSSFSVCYRTAYNIPPSTAINAWRVSSC